MLTRRIAVTAAAGVLAFAGTLATAPSADAQDVGTTEACWTTFSPGNPQGGPFLHRYKNCNPQAIEVASGYDKDGQTTILSECRYVPRNGTTTWSYGFSVKGAQYKTIVCLYPA